MGRRQRRRERKKKAYIELDGGPEVDNGKEANGPEGTRVEKVDRAEMPSGVGSASPAAVEQSKEARLAFLRGLSVEPRYQEMVTALASILVRFYLLSFSFTDMYNLER